MESKIEFILVTFLGLVLINFVVFEHFVPQFYGLFVETLASLVIAVLLASVVVGYRRNREPNSQ
ncbi:hypothetical protein U3A55_12205 [Salarchaeum sp. III]|uniref:hypothetical protein n=1 Tax=Salarchaeum sp. III TaxID=3107927 RepID=UPI002ED7B978